MQNMGVVEKELGDGGAKLGHLSEDHLGVGGGLGERDVIEV